MKKNIQPGHKHSKKDQAEIMKYTYSLDPTLSKNRDFVAPVVLPKYFKFYLDLI